MFKLYADSMKFQDSNSGLFSELLEYAVTNNIWPATERQGNIDKFTIIENLDSPGLQFEFEVVTDQGERRKFPVLLFQHILLRYASVSLKSLTNF